MSKKKLDNMTMDERMAYWAKQQQNAVTRLNKYATSVASEALHGGGVRYIYCDDFNELYDAAETVRRLFNMDVK
jgi:hypothetical protein